MDANIASQQRFYRRGLVLGFTMAEITVIIIFALLLAVAALLKSREDAVDALMHRAITAEAQVAQLQQSDADKQTRISALEEQIKWLRPTTMRKNQFDDLFRELQAAKQGAARAAQLKAQLMALEERTNTIEQLARQLIPTDLTDAPMAEKVAWLDGMIQVANQATRAVRDVGLPADSPQATRMQIEKLVTVVQSLHTEMEKQGGEGSRLDHFINQTVGQMRQVQAQVTSLQGQLRHAQRLMEGAGRGTEKPACWASPETGRPEYIFDAALTSTGIIVRDNALPHRREEQRQLPLSMMVFGDEVSLARFIAISLPLFAWSNERDCRFFVRVFDLTRAHEKDVYKRHLRTVGQHFYSYEVLGAKF